MPLAPSQGLCYGPAMGSSLKICAAAAAVLLVVPSLFAQFPSARTELRGVYFTETGCGHCDAFLTSGAAKLEEAYGVRLILEKHDILSVQGYALCESMLADRGLKFTAFPVLFMGNNAYRGSAAVEAGIRGEIEHYLKHASYRPALSEAPAPAASGAAAAGFTAAFLPVFAAGLLDGINPCAFSTMLFFLSFVGLRRKERRGVALTGLGFIAGVFAAYFFLGFGLLSALRTFLSAGRFSLYLNAAISAAAAIMAALSLRDAAAARRGAPEDSVLQLPGFLKRAGHAAIRRFSVLPLYVLGAALTGILVSFIELACTGQIYLPTLAYMNRAAFSSYSLALLFAYNLAFILPLSAVFALYLLGTGHDRMREWYRRRLVLVRVLSALFFLSLGILVWVV